MNRPLPADLAALVRAGHLVEVEPGLFRRPRVPSRDEAPDQPLKSERPRRDETTVARPPPDREENRVSSPVCNTCDGWIDSGNRAFPDYCSDNCRRKQKDRAAALAQSRADRRQHAAAHQPVRHYPT